MSDKETNETMNPSQKRLLNEATEVPERLQNAFGGGVYQELPLLSEWNNTFNIILIINGRDQWVPLSIKVSVNSANIEDAFPLISLEIIWDIAVLYNPDTIPRENVDQLDGACYEVLSSLVSQSSGTTVKQGDRTHLIEFGSRWFDNHQTVTNMASALEDYIQRIQAGVRGRWQEIVDRIEKA